MGCHFCGVSNCATNHYGNNHGHNDYDDHDDYGDYGNNDNDLYYYRKGNKRSKKNKR